jgi:hypothetical protein
MELKTRGQEAESERKIEERRKIGIKLAGKGFEQIENAEILNINLGRRETNTSVKNQQIII